MTALQRETLVDENRNLDDQLRRNHENLPHQDFPHEGGIGFGDSRIKDLTQVDVIDVD